MFPILKIKPIKQKELIYLITLLIISISINQYYGFVGVNPIDSFFSFNSGYEVLNGHFPFKDFWTITGPFIDYTVALIFKIFGVSWFSYIFYASIFNFIFSISTFYTLYKFNLNINYCFFYALLVSILAYPSSGTPYVDHQASYLSIIAVFCFLLALKTNLKIYWFFLPIIFGISFLTKQAPTSQIFIIISVLSTFYFLLNFNFKKLLYGISGSLLIILIFFLTLYINKIPINAFYEQYILFPISLGESRVEFLFPLEFERIISRFKLLHFSFLIMVVVLVKNLMKNYKYLFDKEILIILALISSTFALIAHQLMTINGLFIFFIIPILCGFSHIYYIKYFSDKKYLLVFLLLLSFSSTLYYGYKYVHKRQFLDLNKIDITKSVNAITLDKKLSNLKWITILNPNNPNNEILKLNEAINVIKSDNKNKAIVTDYQFISVILSSYDYSPNKYWYKHHAYPSLNQKYFEVYKKFFLSKLKQNNIQIFYIVKPLWGDNNVLEDVLDESCYRRKVLTEILESYTLLNCIDLNNN